MSRGRPRHQRNRRARYAPRRHELEQRPRVPFNRTCRSCGQTWTVDYDEPHCPHCRAEYGPLELGRDQIGRRGVQVVAARGAD